MTKKLYCAVVPKQTLIDTTQVHRGTAHTCPSNSSVGTTSRRLVRPERARGRTGRCVINRRNQQVCIQYDRDGGHLHSRRCCFSFCRIRWSLLPLSSPFRLSSVSRSAIPSLSLPSSSSFSHPAPRLIALLAQVVFARLLIVALFRVFCTMIAVANRCLAVVVLSYRSLSLYLHSSPCSTLDRLDAVTWFGLLLLNPPLSLSCASSLLSSLSSRTRFVPHETKLSLRHLQDLFPIYSTRCSALIAWPAV